MNTNFTTLARPPGPGPQTVGYSSSRAQTLTTDPIRAPTLPGVLASGVLLALVKVALRTAGLRPLVRLIHRHTHHRLTNTRDARATEVANIERVVAFAGALFPGRALCLEQSLVLWYLLQRRGLQACFVLGVQPFPFAAHAWVECNGQPVNDVPEHVAHFTPLPDISG